MQRRINLMNQFFPEQNQASDRFNSMIQNAPQLNKPGFMDKLTAGLSGLGQYNKQTGMYTGGGPDVVNKVLYAPYLRDVAAWKEQLAPAQQAATIENTSNNISRQAGSTMVNAEVAAERARLQEKTAAAKQASLDDYNREKLRIDAAKQEMQAAKMQQPNMEYKTGADGYVYGYDRNSRTPPWNTGVRETDMTPREKMFYGIASALALQGVKGQNAIDVKSTPPGAVDKPETGKEFTDRQQMAWKTMWDKGDRKYLTKDASGFFELANQPVESEGYGIGDWGVVTKDDVAAWQRAHDAGYPTQAPTQTPNTIKPPAPAPDGGIQSQPSSGTGTGGRQFQMPRLPAPSGGGQIGVTPGLFNIGQTQNQGPMQGAMAPMIPDDVPAGAPQKGDRVGDADQQQAGVQSGQLAVVQGPDGKQYTVPVANVDRMLADPQFAGYRRVK
jgi:hypothetical protein